LRSRGIHKVTTWRSQSGDFFVPKKPQSWVSGMDRRHHLAQPLHLVDAPVAGIGEQRLGIAVGPHAGAVHPPLLHHGLPEIEDRGRVVALGDVAHRIAIKPAHHLAERGEIAVQPRHRQIAPAGDTAACGPQSAEQTIEERPGHDPSRETRARG
jgi:hypothetical protein